LLFKFVYIDRIIAKEGVSPVTQINESWKKIKVEV